MTRVALLFASLGLAALAPLHADFLADRKFNGEVALGRIHLMAIHSEGRQLVIAAPEFGVKVRADVPPPMQVPPKRLVWILPIGGRAERAVALPGGTPVWSEIRRWSSEAIDGERGPRGGGGKVPQAEASSTEVRMTAKGGPAAVAELNAWLTELDVAPVDAARLDPIAKRGYGFALVVYTATEGKPLSNAGILPAIAYERWTSELSLPFQLIDKGSVDVTGYALTRSGLETACGPLASWLGVETSEVAVVHAKALPGTVDHALTSPALGLGKLTGSWFAARLGGAIKGTPTVRDRDGVKLAAAADLVESGDDPRSDRRRRVVQFGVVLVLGLGLGILYGKARGRKTPPVQPPRR